MLERLQGALEANRRFAASASHELRTPLAAIQGEVEVALRRERAPEPPTARPWPPWAATPAR